MNMKNATSHQINGREDAMKTYTTHRRKSTLLRTLAGSKLLRSCVAYTFIYGQVVLAAPQGEQVVSGQASFNRQGDVTQITAGNNAIINYSGFDIHSHETVQFIQPSAAARVLNRVNSPDPTTIAGTLLSNGQVFIVNPAGVYFTNGSLVDVGGIYAAAGQITNADFLNNVDHFTSVAGSVVNHGTIQAGTVNLIGQQVANYGSIVVDRGVVTMVSGEDVLLGKLNDHYLVKISGAANTNADGSTGVQNAGSVTADQGKVKLAVGDMFSLVLQPNSNIKAGQISVEGGNGSVVQVAGTLDASNAAGKGGAVHVLGDRVGVDQANIDASGSTGGGEVLIGGDFQGKGTVLNASRTFIGSGATIKADATGPDGDGGRVIAWADDITAFQGSISARGGSNSGNGGFAEVSGKQNLIYHGTVDLTAANGNLGTLLLDPKNITIGSAAGASLPAAVGGTITVGFSDTPSAPSVDAVFQASAISTALNTANLILQANNDITVNTAINAVAAGAGGPTVGDLTFRAGRTIDINAGIALRGSFTAIANDPGATAGAGAAVNGRDAGLGGIDIADNATVSTVGAAKTISLTVDASTPATAGNINLGQNAIQNGFSGASISSNGIITLSAAASAITRNSGNTFNVIASASGVNSTNVAVDLTARTIGSTANPLIFNTIGSLSVADTGSGNIDVSVLAPATLDVAVNVGGLGFGTIKVLTGGTEAVNIGDNLAIGVVNISGPFAFTGTGGGITQTGAITATGAGSSVTVTNLTPDASITLSTGGITTPAGGNLSVNTAGTGNATINSGVATTLLLGASNVGGDLSVTSPGTTVVGILTVGGTASLLDTTAASGSIAINAAINSAGLNVDTTNDIGVNANLTATNSILLKALGQVSFNASGPTLTSNNIAIDAVGNINGLAGGATPVQIVGATAGTSPGAFSITRGGAITDAILPATTQFAGSVSGMDYAIRATSGTITLANSTKVAGTDLTLEAAGGVNLTNLNLSGAGAALQSLTINGTAATTFNNSTIVTSGSQSYTGPINLTGDATLNDGASASGFTFAAISGVSTADLAVTTDGGITFNGTINGIGSLTTDADAAVTFVEGVAGTTSIGNITLNGTGAVAFQKDVGTSTSRVGTGLGSTAAVTINTTGTTQFNGQVFARSGIAQADTAGKITFKNNIDVNTAGTTSVQPTQLSGDVDFDATSLTGGLTFTSTNAVTLGNAATDTATLIGGPVAIKTTGAGSNAIVLNAAVAGAQGLTLESPSRVTLNGTVGSSTTPLAGLTVTANDIDIANNINTTGLVSLQPFTNTRLIDLGTDEGVADTFLGLSQTELGFVTAGGGLAVGGVDASNNPTSSGGITISQVIDFTGSGVTELQLRNKGAIAPTTGSSLTVDAVAINTDGAINLTGITANVLAAKSTLNSIALNAASDLTIGNVAGLNGLITTDQAITITVDGNLILNGSIDAGTGTVSLTMVAGSGGSIQGPGTVTAGQLAIDADASVGSAANRLLTVAGTLAADVDGDLFVSNTGDLDIGTVGSLVGVTTLGGGADISAASSITVSQAMNVDGDLKLTATGTGGNITVSNTVDAKGDLTLDASNNVTVANTVDAQGLASLTAGNDVAVNNKVTGAGVDVAAGNDVTFNGSGNLTSTGGDVSVQATTSATGAITMAAGSGIDAGSDTISLDANDDVTLTGLTTTNATSTAVAVTSQGGSILDAGDTADDITATGGTATLTAGTTPAATTSDVGTTANSIEVNVNLLAVDANRDANISSTAGPSGLRLTGSTVGRDLTVNGGAGGITNSGLVSVTRNTNLTGGAGFILDQWDVDGQFTANTTGFFSGTSMDVIGDANLTGNGVSLFGVWSVGGNLTADAGATAALNNSNPVGSTDLVTVSGNAVLAGGSINMQHLDVTGTVSIDAASDATINNAKSVQLEAVNVPGTLSVTAVGDITKAGGAAAFTGSTARFTTTAGTTPGNLDLDNLSFGTIDLASIAGNATVTNAVAFGLFGTVAGNLTATATSGAMTVGRVAPFFTPSVTVTGLASLTATGSSGGVTLIAPLIADGVTINAGANPFESRFGPTGIFSFNDGSINAGTGDILVTADNVILAANLTGTGALILQPNAAGTDIGVGTGSAGAFQIDSTELSLIQNGFASITIGVAGGSGLIDVRNFQVSDPLTLLADNGGSIAVNGAIIGADDASITLDTGGTGETGNISLAADIATVGGGVSLDGNVLIGSASQISIDSAGGGITVTGSVDQDTTGSGATGLLLAAGAGDVDVQGDIGGTSAVDWVDFAGQNITLNGVNTNTHLGGIAQRYTVAGGLITLGAATSGQVTYTSQIGHIQFVGNTNVGANTTNVSMEVISKGNIDLQGSTSTLASTGAGNLTAKANSGRVTTKDVNVKGLFTAEGSTGVAVNNDAVVGSLSATSASGTVSLQKVTANTGGVTATSTSFGDVLLNGAVTAAGTVSAKAFGGDVEVHDIGVSSGDIDLQANANVTTTFEGRVPLGVVIINSSLTAQNGDIKIGSGGRSSTPSVATIIGTGDLTINTNGGKFEMGVNEKLIVDGVLDIRTGGGSMTLSDLGATGNILADAGAGTIFFNARPSAQVLTSGSGLLQDSGLDVVSKGSISFKAGSIQNAGGGAFPAGLAPLFASGGSTPISIIVTSGVDPGLRLGSLQSAGFLIFGSTPGGNFFDFTVSGSTGRLDVLVPFIFPPQSQEIADVPNETNLEQSEKDLLRIIGVPAVDLEAEDLIAFVIGGSWVINDVPSPEAELGEHQVTVVRMLRSAVPEALRIYKSLYVGPLVDEAGNEIAPSKPTRVREVLTQAWIDYRTMGDQMGPMTFDQYLASSPEMDEAAHYVSQLRDLFSLLKVMGLTEWELGYTKEVLLKREDIIPKGMGMTEFERLILQPSPAVSHVPAQDGGQTPTEDQQQPEQVKASLSSLEVVGQARGF